MGRSFGQRRVAPCTLPTMDAGVAALLAAAITGVVALAAAAIGPVIGYVLERRRRTDKRIREFRLVQLERTERGLLLQLMVFEAMTHRDVDEGLRLAAETGELGAPNPLDDRRCCRPQDVE